MSTTSSKETFKGGKSQGADGATRLEIEYETVEVLTPETWNRFANLEKREMANLFVENRIPSQTEKVLCEIGYDMGRITRNKLKSVLEDSPSAATMTPSPRSPKSRRGGRTRKIETVTEQGEDLLNREEQSLQSEQSQSAARRAKNRTGSRGQASSGRSIRAAAARGWHSPRAAENGKTRGARRGQRSRSTITLTKAAQLSPTDPEVMTVNAVKLVLTTSAKEEEGVSSASSVLPDEAGGEVVEKTDGAASSEQPVEDIEANVTQASSQKLLIHKKRSFAGEVGDDMERNEFSRKRLKSETAGQQQPPFYAGEANAEVNERSAFGKESFTSGAVQTANESIPILQTGTVYSQYGLASMKRSDQLKNPVFRELEELPLPISTNAVVQTESNRFRRHLLNRGPPFKNFQALRSAVLEGHLAGVRWTARCFAEKRGYDFNQSFRGKTLISELCERKCNTWSSPHELEDMLRMLVIGGARLDVPEEHRLRMPLHTAVETGSWCLVRALLYLRSPVNVCDASEKTPLHLVVQNSDPATVRAIYLLLQFGADVNDVLKTVRNNRYRERLEEHQGKITNAFEEARMKTFTGISVKRTLTPVMVRAMWEAEGNNFTAELSFFSEISPLPNNLHVYIIVLAVFDYCTARYWRVRMWGRSPFESVRMNNNPTFSLQNDPNGFVYGTKLLNGWNRLQIRYRPFVRNKKYLLMAQIVLAQRDKPPVCIPPPMLEIASESGTDWIRS